MKIHYADVDLNGDIPCYEFETREAMREFVFEKLAVTDSFVSEKIVYLVAINGSYTETEVFVTQNKTIVEELFDGISTVLNPFDHDVYIQEYKSFESAYAVALSMQEISQICYD